MTKPMNKIERLIAELCPEGVEFEELGEMITLEYGKPLKESERSGGNFPVLGSNGRIGFHGSYLIEGPCIIIGRKGSAGAVVWEEQNCYPIDTTFFVKIQNFKILLKYLYYQFQTLNLASDKQDGGVPGLNRNNVYKILIPIPPLAIQQEIVKILDTFTTLEAELEAELEARKKQYEYYREELLIFGDDVEWNTLGEVCEMKAGKSISASDIATLRSGNNVYPCIGGNGSRGYVNSFSHSGKFPIIGRQGALCGNVCFAEGKFYATEHAVVVKHGEQFGARFLYHLLLLMNLNQYATGGAQPGLAVSKLEKIKIPVPPLADQERIVAILDQFDALVNDISVGLPAELNTRRKQYEYYRGKLLTFQEKNDEKQ